MQENEEKNIKIVAGSKSRVILQPQSRNNGCKEKGSLDEWLSQRSAKPYGGSNPPEFKAKEGLGMKNFPILLALGLSRFFDW